MADLDLTASTTFRLMGFAGGSRLSSVQLSASEDFKLVDNLEAVTVVFEVRSAATASSEVPDNSLRVPVKHCLKRAVNMRELQALPGVLQTSDVRFNLPKANLPLEPDEQTRIETADGATYNVVAIMLSPVTDRYVLYARR